MSTRRDKEISALKAEIAGTEKFASDGSGRRKQRLLGVVAAKRYCIDIAKYL
ncbi:MAG: hypothetical protein H0A75_07960 [Candidatus Methanofishera endochildressiae]|uniref:Uncharacterized protein n=1 Tax=Candidatus Methanofishera endochildressiae TaxID=2738884 RepID=A0A7Z0MPI1_9GAMM|nr:hypothetical protein [Candidatus Methanofishera endochildressiae]